MKLYLLACAAFVVVLQSVNAEPVGTCPSTMNPEKVDFLVDSDDCGIFYKCNWGKPVKFDCPANLHFNQKLEVCDWPEAAGCGGDDSGDSNGSSSSSSSSESDEHDDSSPEPVPEPEPQPEPEPENPDDNSSSSSSSSSSESGSDEDGGSSEGKCPNDPCPKINGEHPVYFAHPETCTRFCQCDWGVAHDMPCPDGLHFNTELNVCDWKENAGCE